MELRQHKMPNTFTLIASTTVGSGGASSVVFSSIPATYTDLVLKISSRTDRVGIVTDSIWIKLNNTSTNYASKFINTQGTSGAVTTTVNPLEQYSSSAGSGGLANTFSNAEFYIANYASAINKSASSEGVVNTNVASVQNLSVATLSWTDTTAISSMTLVPGYGTTILENSTFHLYGIKNS
jgi:hypothetical protein